MAEDFNFDVQEDTLEVVITELFDAPRSKVWKAYTDAKLIPEWWGPRGLSTTVEKQELKPGGSWRYVQIDKDGKEFAFRGKYQTVKAPQELAFTFEWEEMPGHILNQTTVLEEKGKQTRVVTSMVSPTLEDLKGMVGLGMEKGNHDGHDRMVELLARMK